MNYTWLTDIHLNFVDYDKRLNFYNRILKMEADNVLISGDIAEASSVIKFLKEMAEIIKKPIYFVLGNHDYYSGTIDSVRDTFAVREQRTRLLRFNILPVLIDHE